LLGCRLCEARVEKVSNNRPKTAIVLRPIGTPLPLGFLGLVVASTAFSAVQLAWVAPEQGRVAGLTVLALSVPLQALAAVLGFFSRDPIAGTGMAIQAGGWASIGLVTITTPPGASTPGLGVVLAATAVALLVPTVAGSSKPLAAAVLGMTGVRFAVTALAELTGLPGWQTAAGVVGLVVAVVALYAALAFELEGAHGHAVLPMWRRGPAAEAISAGTETQVSGAEHEPGVRRQL
jgi:uncharacterized protein